MQLADPLDIFAALDTDRSGYLDIDEFCDGLWQVVVSQVPVEVRRMEKQIEHLCEKVQMGHNTVISRLDGIAGGDMATHFTNPRASQRARKSFAVAARPSLQECTKTDSESSDKAKIQVERRGQRHTTRVDRCHTNDSTTSPQEADSDAGAFAFS